MKSLQEYLEVGGIESHTDLYGNIFVDLPVKEMRKLTGFLESISRPHKKPYTRDGFGAQEKLQSIMILPEVKNMELKLDMNDLSLICDGADVEVKTECGKKIVVSMKEPVEGIDYVPPAEKRAEAEE